MINTKIPIWLWITKIILWHRCPVPIPTSQGSGYWATIGFDFWRVLDYYCHQWELSWNQAWWWWAGPGPVINTIPERFDDVDGGDDPGDADEHDEQDLDQCHRHDTGGIQVEIFRKSAASAFQTFANTWKYFKHTCEHVHSAHFKTRCLQFLHTTQHFWQHLNIQDKSQTAHCQNQTRQCKVHIAQGDMHCANSTKCKWYSEGWALWQNLTTHYKVEIAHSAKWK